MNLNQQWADEQSLLQAVLTPVRKQWYAQSPLLYIWKAQCGYPWESTLAVVPKILSYIARVFSQGYPTFPFVPSKTLIHIEHVAEIWVWRGYSSERRKPGNAFGSHGSQMQCRDQWNSIIWSEEGTKWVEANNGRIQSRHRNLSFEAWQVHDFFLQKSCNQFSTRKRWQSWRKKMNSWRWRIQDHRWAPGENCSIRLKGHPLWLFQPFDCLPSLPHDWGSLWPLSFTWSCGKSFAGSVYQTSVGNSASSGHFWHIVKRWPQGGILMLTFRKWLRVYASLCGVCAILWRTGTSIFIYFHTNTHISIHMAHLAIWHIYRFCIYILCLHPLTRGSLQIAFLPKNYSILIARLAQSVLSSDQNPVDISL